MGRPAKIIGIDVLWLDELVSLSSVPDFNCSAAIDNLSIQGGGKVCSALFAAARQDIPCQMIGLCGNSAQSKFLVDDFAYHNIDVSTLRTVPGYQEGYSVVLSGVQTGERRILWYYDNDQQCLQTEDIDEAEEAISKAEYLHLCRMDSIGRYAAEVARRHGTKISYDADFYTEDVLSALPWIDILIGSEEFYQALFPAGGDMQRNLQIISKQGPTQVVFTFGKHGCKGISTNDYFEIPAFHDNIQVVDTVGAGDVFHGGYLAALCYGLEPMEAARYASAVSAIKCTAVGGRAGIPSREMVLQYLASGTFPREEIELRTLHYRKRL